MSEPAKKPGKQPQDHQGKAEAETPPPDRVQTVTWEGHAYRIDPKRMDDISFMELLSEMDTKPYYMAKVVGHILGADQWAAFKTDHADADGLVSSERVGEFFGAVNEQLSLGN